MKRNTVTITRKDEKMFLKGVRQKLWKGIPKKVVGRNFQGKITIQHRGGGHKRRLRTISDGYYPSFNGVVKGLVNDPRRNSHLALIFCMGNENGKKLYIIAPEGLKVGMKIKHHTSEKDLLHLNLGDSCRLKNFQKGDLVNNIEWEPGSGGKIARSAGTSGRVIDVDYEKNKVLVALGKSKKIERKIFFSGECFARLGEVSNKDFRNQKLRKAGDSRRRGIRPTVRGVAKNPVDHEHGGGKQLPRKKKTKPPKWKMCQKRKRKG